MYETVESHNHGCLRLPADVAQRFRELAGSVEERSQIVWGEHCSECAFPACYGSCAFYTPRRDLHCRRFADGVKQARVSGIELARIQFRKWAKLEGVGPAAMMSRQRAAAREKFDRLVSRGITALSPTFLVYARSARHWNSWKSSPSRKEAEHRPDAFVLEAWLEDGPDIALTLTILQAGDRQPAFFQKRLDLTLGYNRFVVPQAAIDAQVDTSATFLIQIEPIGDVSGRSVVFGLIDFVRFKCGIEGSPAPIGATAAQADASMKRKQLRTAKCVVWDLDNTIWKGTLAEDGKEALKLYDEVPGIVAELDRRGILQSIASKNDSAPALAALEAFGLREYMLFPQVGWGPKSDSVRRIAESLDIGLDTFAFVDDEPFERGEVSAALPMVAVLAGDQLPDLLTNPLFDVPATAEGSKRRAMYQVEELRQTTYVNSGTDYVSFLRSCNIRLTIDDLSDRDMERAYELSQRTNQLNFSGTKYARSDISALLRAGSSSSAFVLRCEDRFGDYGIIGMCVLENARGCVQSFMMSCRVQRKRVEAAFFAWLTQRLGAAHSQIEVAYRKTSRNQASVRMLEELGFDFHATGVDEGLYVRRVDQPFVEDNVVHILDRTKLMTDAL